jgi:glycogen operon protein
MAARATVGRFEAVMRDWSAAEGSPSPLGVSWSPSEHAYNFALYSMHATDVTLLLYASVDVARPRYQFHLNPLTNKSGPVWHCRIRLSEIPEATYYAYRVAGPQRPEEGHRFDDQKILFDHYASALFFPERFSRNAARRPGSNAGCAPLGVLAPTAKYDWKGDRRPRHTSDAIIYELHVSAFTKRPNSGISMEKRGTCRRDREDSVPQGTGNHRGRVATSLPAGPAGRQLRGYMPLSFFSPHHGFAIQASSENVVDEFRDMVKALHAADIEVILEVVYTHTAEGPEDGPTYSYRGLDNSTYYLLQPDRRRYRDDTGTGSTLDCADRYVRKMIVDSLHVWAEEMHVDGFRFDTASNLYAERGRFDQS